MLSATELIDIAAAFMDKGGTALWAIMAVSLLMWILIIERYLYLYYSYPRQLEDVKTAWRHYKNAPLPIAMRLRTGLIRELQVSAGAYLQSITVLSQTLPLLGLLGTVFGMIHTFEVIAMFGNGNARGMAGGISEALLTTMAGLVTALSGIYLSSNLNERVRTAIDKAEDELDWTDCARHAQSRLEFRGSDY
ncbi:MotA/TolQ/ExbB proton channel family protein [Methylobacter marinus]|uniref:MotA/TolQ/ExbB proton channel family protein n=1 Tax=Methylobacter marinus TaxID=34058 RepID=UPI000363D242|nr:MotA/TolQ/ExbB proton channel family protein [Methylobacter marinus]